MRADKNVVSITVHPKFQPKVVSYDMDGVPFCVGDEFIDLTGNRGEIRQLLDNQCAQVVVGRYNKRIIVDTSSLLRVAKC